MAVVANGIIVKGKKLDIIDERVKPKSEQQQQEAQAGSRPLGQTVCHPFEAILSSPAEEG
jgi:hypothetical protein